MPKGLPKRIKDKLRRRHRMAKESYELMYEIEEWFEAQGVDPDLLRDGSNEEDPLNTETLTAFDDGDGDVDECIESLEEAYLRLKGVE